MERTTQKQLDYLVNRINEVTGSPKAPYRQTKDGYRANHGNYHIDSAYGGVQLVRMCSEGGGVSPVSRDGFGTKRQLHAFMTAFLAGFQAGQE